MSTKLTTIIAALLMIMTALTGCISSDGEEEVETIKLAFSVQDDYENIDENPQIFADYLSEELGMNVEIYPITSEGAAIEALRFGNAHFAFLDGGSGWVGWQQYDLQVAAADVKSDGRAYYEAHAWVLNDSEMAEALNDGNDSTDPFALLEGKTSCHTGWLKSAGMLMPMGYLIGNEYADVVGDADTVESLRDTIYEFFSENASIPESGTPYHGYGGAVKCLSEGYGEVAFAKDSTIESYCGSDDPSENADWCLEMERYVPLPAFGQSPSHPVMYNPVYTEDDLMNQFVAAMVGMSEDPQGQLILENILNTDSIIPADTESHLGSYGGLIENVPGITAYYGDKYDINE